MKILQYTPGARNICYYVIRIVYRYVPGKRRNHRVGMMAMMMINNTSSTPIGDRIDIII